MIELRKTIKFPPHPFSDIWTVTARKWKDNGEVKEKVRFTCEEDRNFHRYFLDTNGNLNWDNEERLTEQLLGLLKIKVKEHLAEQNCDDDTKSEYVFRFPDPIEE